MSADDFTNYGVQKELPDFSGPTGSGYSACDSVHSPIEIFCRCKGGNFKLQIYGNKKLDF